jgi:hypothetical protein
MFISPNTDILSGLIGGAILAVATSGLIYTTGKITGISGIVENVVTNNNWHGDLAYMAGLVASGGMLAVAKPEVFGSGEASPFMTMVAAGLLVGIGTRVGSGCTSGHGLCGLSRFSPRSFASVMSFMGAGAVSAYLSAHTSVLDFLKSSPSTAEILTTQQALTLTGTLTSIYSITFFLKGKKFILPKFDRVHVYENISHFMSALVFGMGLGVSGMCDPARVTGFLDFTGKNGWDYTLAGVMGAGVVINAIVNLRLHKSDTHAPFSAVKRQHSKALKIGRHEDNLKIDKRLIFGGIIFGFGWGLGGVCPGPSLVAWGALGRNALVFVPSMISGMALVQYAKI